MKLKDVLKLMLEMRVDGRIIRDLTRIELVYREALIKKSFSYRDLDDNRELLDVEISSIISIETITVSVSIVSVTLEVKE